MRIKTGREVLETDFIRVLWRESASQTSVNTGIFGKVVTISSSGISERGLWAEPAAGLFSGREDWRRQAMQVN
jgi:hypothetical protein